MTKVCITVRIRSLRVMTTAEPGWARIASLALNNLDPYAYLKATRTRSPLTIRKSGIDKLLPWAGLRPDRSAMAGDHSVPLHARQSLQQTLQP